MKNRIAVVYQSKTGFTEKYAKLAAEKVDCDLLKFSEITAERLSQYEVVVFGSRAYAGRIDGYEKMRKLLQKAGVERFAVFVTGAAPNDAKEVVERLWGENLTREELSVIPHFYMQSGLCYERMGLLDRFLMKAAAVMMRKKKEESPEKEGFEQAISGSYDISSEKYLLPLIEWMRGEA